MLERIRTLYVQGKLGPVFQKTAEDILQNELRKIAIRIHPQTMAEVSALGTKNPSMNQYITDLINGYSSIQEDLANEAMSGLGSARLSPEEWDVIDQFHTMAAGAKERTIPEHIRSKLVEMADTNETAKNFLAGLSRAPGSVSKQTIEAAETIARMGMNSTPYHSDGVKFIAEAAAEGIQGYQDAVRVLTQHRGSVNPTEKMFLDQFVEHAKSILNKARLTDAQYALFEKKILEGEKADGLIALLRSFRAPSSMSARLVGETGAMAEEASKKGLFRNVWDYLKKPAPRYVTGAIALGSLAGLAHLHAAANRSAADTAYTEIFNNIIKEHPELDLSKASKNFDALRKMSPHLAANQEAAYGFLRQAEEWPYLHMGAVKELAQTEKNISDSGGDSIYSKSLSELGKSLSQMVAFGLN